MHYTIGEYIAAGDDAHKPVGETTRPADVPPAGPSDAETLTTMDRTALADAFLAANDQTLPTE